MTPSAVGVLDGAPTGLESRVAGQALGRLVCSGGDPGQAEDARGRQRWSRLEAVVTAAAVGATLAPAVGRSGQPASAHPRQCGGR